MAKIGDISNPKVAGTQMPNQDMAVVSLCMNNNRPECQGSVLIITGGPVMVNTGISSSQAFNITATQRVSW